MPKIMCGYCVGGIILGARELMQLRLHHGHRAAKAADWLAVLPPARPVRPTLVAVFSACGGFALIGNCPECSCCLHDQFTIHFSFLQLPGKTDRLLTILVIRRYGASECPK